MMALETLPLTDGSAVAYGSSQSTDPATAAQELQRSLSQVDPACVIFFCCVDYDREVLGRALASLFGDIPVLGCTTAGEISPLGMRSGSIAGFALSVDHFVVETALLTNLASFSEGGLDSIKHAIGRLESRALAVGEHSFALSLLDGLSVQEELVLSALGDALPGIPLVGGSAGDNLHFCDTHIYYDKQFYSNAAAIILVNTRCPFTVIQGHHLKPCAEKLVVTKADAAKRVVYEFNAEPAALEYCRIMGISLDQLNNRSFALYPLSVQVGDNSFVRSVQRVNEDLSLTFFCAIDTGIVLTKMSNGRLVEEFGERMAKVVDEVGDPQLVIGYDCIHRRIEAEDTNTSERLEALYRRYNVVGFNTYGEHCDAMHVNHTFTGIAIGNYGGKLG